MYRRLAEALADRGLDPVSGLDAPAMLGADASVLDSIEVAIMRRTYKEYGGFAASHFSRLTRCGNAPWEELFNGGAG